MRQCQVHSGRDLRLTTQEPSSRQGSQTTLTSTSLRGGIVPKAPKHRMFSRHVAPHSTLKVALVCTTCHEKHCSWRVWSPFLHLVDLAEKVHAARHAREKNMAGAALDHS